MQRGPELPAVDLGGSERMANVGLNEQNKIHYRESLIRAVEQWLPSHIHRSIFAFAASTSDLEGLMVFLVQFNFFSCIFFPSQGGQSNQISLGVCRLLLRDEKLQSHSLEK